MERYSEYKDSGVKWLGEIPSHWKLLKSKYLWKETFENSTSGKEDLLSVSQYTGVTKSKADSRSESLVGYKIVHKDDLVINIMLAWLGGLGVSNNEGVVSPAYCTYKLIRDYNPKFLHYLYKTPMYLAEFARHSTGVVPSRWRMYTDDFGQVVSLLPPVEEQDAIVRYLDAATSKIDKAIAMQQKMIDLLNERKQIIIQNAVTKGLNENVEMKDSGVEWIGMIPKHWEIEPFGKHFTFGKGLPITKANLQEEGIAVISYGQVHAKYNLGTTLTETLVRYVSPKYIETHPQCLLDKNDFIFADTSEDVEGSGNFAFNDYKDKIFAGYHTVVARPKDLIYPKYYAYLFKSRAWKSQIQSLVNGVKVYSIGKRILKTSTLLIPSESEQKEIVKVLDLKTAAIEKSIENISRQITLLQERKQIIINEVVTGKVKVL